MSVASISGWYQKCLSSRSVPLKSLPQNPTSTECYVLRVQCAEFNQDLDPLKRYRLHVHLYDTKSKQFFGRKFYGALRSARANKIDFQIEIFFHSTVRDERIILVAEISRKENNDEFVEAWTVVPIFLNSQPITDYGSNLSVPIQLKKYQLYNGTPKILYYVKSIDSNNKLVKANGVLECILQTHQQMVGALDFIPEFVLISNEHIPGLKTLSGVPQLAHPTPADSFTAVLDNVSMSFGMHADRIERLLLELINRENCFSLNKPPNDKSIEKLQILERRLRIGIHNGFTFVEEPLCLYLASKDEADSGSHSYRKRSRSMSRMTPNVRSEFDTFTVKNAVKLSHLCADEDFAIVFAVDYLLGVQKSESSVSDSRFVMLCWGAWSPYQNNTFTLSDSISVPLVGGPRPNPDEIFCFRSLLRIRENEYEAFSDGRPRITLRFNFALVGSTDNQLLLHILNRSQAETSGMQTTPLPKPDIIVKPQPIELEEDERKGPIPTYPISDHVYEEPPMILSKDLDPLRRRQSFSIYERHQKAFQESYQTIETFTSSVSTFPRGVLSFLARTDFPRIFDRNGQIPTVIDPASKNPINFDLETNSRMSTSEIVLQFMAITHIKNSYITPIHKIVRYFFTLQFYRFPSLTTERLLAYPNDGKPSDPLVLKRIDDNNHIIEKNGNGLMIRLTIDKSSLPQTHPDDFIQYLAYQHLYIDVWDADSLIHIGTAALPLRFLCRQGAGAIQANVQCPVVQAGLPQEPVVTGLLYLKMANIGHPSNNQLDLYTSQNDAASIVSQRLLRLGQNTQESYKIRAKPLNAIHGSAIQRFLTAQKLDIHQRKEELFANENINRIRLWNELKKQQVTTIPKSSLKRFIFQEELEAYKFVRNEGKASKLLKAVFKAITIQHTIQPEFGQVEFFEFALHNTYTQAINCILDINDHRLGVVTNPDEWKFFKAANNLKTPLERDLIQFEDTGEISIYLNAMETIFIPFKYDPFQVLDSREPANFTLDPFEIKTIFKRSDNGEPFSIFELTVQYRRYTLGNCFRWFHEGATKVSKLVRIQGIRDNRRVLNVRSTDSTVLCSLRSSPNGGQELLITCHSNETAMVKTFLVLLYADRFYHRLLSIWVVSVHSMQKFNIEAIQGQITKVPLFLRAEYDQLVQFFSSSDSLMVMPSQPFVSTPQILGDVKGRLKPNFSGQRTILVTAVDVNLKRLLYAWLLNTLVCEPNIVKSFEVKIPLSETKTIQRKITIENLYSIPRKYRVHTSNEEIVSPEEEYYDLEPQERANVFLNFYPFVLNKPTVIELLIFIENAESAQQEEAYSLKISYYE